jgi:hypothetical protein
MNEKIQVALFISGVTILLVFAVIGMIDSIPRVSAYIDNFSENKLVKPVQYDYTIPSWIKGIAGFWSKGLLKDSEYFNTLQYLLDHGVIKIHEKTG